MNLKKLRKKAESSARALSKSIAGVSHPDNQKVDALWDLCKYIAEATTQIHKKVKRIRSL